MVNEWLTVKRHLLNKWISKQNKFYWIVGIRICLQDHQEIQLLVLRMCAVGEECWWGRLLSKKWESNLQVQTQRSKLKIAWGHKGLGGGGCQNLTTGATHSVIPNATPTCWCVSARAADAVGQSKQVVFIPEETIWKCNQRPEPRGIIGPRQAWKEDLCPELFGSAVTLAPFGCNFWPFKVTKSTMVTFEGTSSVSCHQRAGIILKQVAKQQKAKVFYKYKHSSSIIDQSHFCHENSIEWTHVVRNINTHRVQCDSKIESNWKYLESSKICENSKKLWPLLALPGLWSWIWQK